MIVSAHIKRLHAYNEAKDAAQVSLRYRLVHSIKHNITGSDGKGSSIESLGRPGSPLFSSRFCKAQPYAKCIRNMGSTQKTKVVKQV